MSRLFFKFHPYFPYGNRYENVIFRKYGQRKIVQSDLKITYFYINIPAAYRVLGKLPNIVFAFATFETKTHEGSTKQRLGYFYFSD